MGDPSPLLSTTPSPYCQASIILCASFTLTAWLLKNLFIYLFWLRWVFVAARGLFSSCGERGLLFVAVHGLLIAVASLVAKHRL